MSTTDPGVEDGIKRAADDVESDQEGDDIEKEAEENYLEPSRWWFASTACPLLAGTIGPVASAFNICALVYNWRVYLPDGVTEVNGLIIKDPPWLVRNACACTSVR
jgi:potassium channel subfamily K